MRHWNASAAATAGALALGTVVVFGPGGIHGRVHWSSTPTRDVAAAEMAEMEVTLRPARGQETGPRQVQPRDTTFLEATDPPPDADPRGKPFPGDFESEEIRNLARVAGAEMARGFLDEIASRLGAPPFDSPTQDSDYEERDPDSELTPTPLEPAPDLEEEMDPDGSDVPLEDDFYWGDEAPFEIVPEPPNIPWTRQELEDREGPVVVGGGIWVEQQPPMIVIVQTPSDVESRPFSREGFEDVDAETIVISAEDLELMDPRPRLGEVPTTTPVSPTPLQGSWPVGIPGMPTGQVPPPQPTGSDPAWGNMSTTPTGVLPPSLPAAPPTGTMAPTTVTPGSLVPLPGLVVVPPPAAVVPPVAPIVPIPGGIVAPPVPIVPPPGMAPLW